MDVDIGYSRVWLSYMSERCQCCQISKCPSLLNICSEQSEQSGRLTDPPPESFLIPQQLAVPPVWKQLDDVPCPKTIGEPGTPHFPEGRSYKICKFAHRSIGSASIGFLFHVTFSGLPCPFLGFKNSHSTHKQDQTSLFHSIFTIFPLCSQHQLSKTIRPSSCAAAFSTTCALVPPTPKELTLAKEPQHWTPCCQTHSSTLPQTNCTNQNPKFTLLDFENLKFDDGHSRPNTTNPSKTGPCQLSDTAARLKGVLEKRFCKRCPSPSAPDQLQWNKD